MNARPVPDDRMDWFDWLLVGAILFLVFGGLGWLLIGGGR